MAVCINELKELPPLSSSAREILKIIHDDDADISQLSRIIERDPALLSRIIGLANSAFFGARSVSSVHRAIIDVLGLRTAKNIVLGVVLGGIFNPRQCQAFDLPRYWFVSLMTATLAKDFSLALKMSSLDANDAYLSGMLNEIGLMAMAYLYPAEMQQVLADDGHSIPAREKELFGQSHYEISAVFLTDWQLPQIVIDVMLESDHNPQTHCGDLCRIICLAHCLANMSYDGLPVDLTEMELPEIIAQHIDVIDAIIKEAGEKVETYREMAGLLS